MSIEHPALIFPKNLVPLYLSSLSNYARFHDQFRQLSVSWIKNVYINHSLLLAPCTGERQRIFVVIPLI